MFSRFSDAIERACAHPLGFLAFTAWCAGMPLLNIDAANYGISVLTAGLLFLTLGSSRRDRLAMHTKLDDLECAVEGADNEKARLEERTEREIEEVRKAVDNESPLF